MAEPPFEKAKSGFAASAIYDLHRPSYPAEAVESLLRSLKVSGIKNARLLDLGAGTGKFTELLAGRDEAYEILAVEPHPNMRAELARKNLPRVNVVEGGAEKMAVDSHRAHAVIVAQAFHWFATEKALNEIYRVIVPGGSLGLIWNVEDYNAPKAWTPSTEWEAKLKEINWSFDDGLPRFRHERWRDIFDRQLSSTPFTIQAADPPFSLPLGEGHVEFEHWLTREKIWDRLHTLSRISVLEGEVLEDTKQRALETMNGPDAVKNDRGEIALHGKTVWAFTAGVPGAPLKHFG